MTLAELGDGGVVRVLVARQVAESYLLVGAPLNFARAVHAGRIAIQKQADHHLRSVGRLTSPILLLVRLVDRAQLQRRYHIHPKNAPGGPREANHEARGETEASDSPYQGKSSGP